MDQNVANAGQSKESWTIELDLSSAYLPDGVKGRISFDLLLRITEARTAVELPASNLHLPDGSGC